MSLVVPDASNGQATFDTTGFVDVKIVTMGNLNMLSEVARWIRSQHFDVILYPEVCPP